MEGAVGSKHKVDATYLSPNVNMASRLEAATKQYGVVCRRCVNLSVSSLLALVLLYSFLSFRNILLSLLIALAYFFMLVLTCVSSLACVEKAKMNVGVHIWTMHIVLHVEVTVGIQSCGEIMGVPVA